MAGRSRRRTRRAEAGLPSAAEPATSSDSVLDDPEKVARRTALRKLAAQPRTRAELAEAIAASGVPDEAAERVLDRLGAVGLVDDAAFADAWVESRHSSRGLAKRMLAHELRRRGVGEQEIGDAVEQISGDDERAAARRLVDDKLSRQRGLRRLDRSAQVRRLAGLLARKGYSAGVAADVIKDALAQAPWRDEADELGEALAPLEETEE